MSSAFTLYGSPHSLPTYRVALMLRLCRTGFRFRYVSFQRGMHLTPEFRSLSRWGQVPVLEHEGRVLVQSAAILEYLAQTLGKFQGASPEARQVIREWLFWDADRLMPPLYGWYSVQLGEQKLLPLSFEPVLVAEFDRKGKMALDVLNAHLRSQLWLVGDAVSIADVCCYGLHRLRQALQQGPVRVDERPLLGMPHRGLARVRLTVRSLADAGQHHRPFLKGLAVVLGTVTAAPAARTS